MLELSEPQLSKRLECQFGASEILGSVSLHGGWLDLIIFLEIMYM